MNTADLRPTTCRYPRARMLLALWPLLIGTVAGLGAVHGLMQGEHLGAAFFILAGGSIFGIGIALLGLLQVMTVVADENGLEAIDIFGRLKARTKWNEVESISHYKWSGERGGNKPPTGYALNRRGDKKGFSFRKHRIGFSEDMDGYEELEKFMLRKAREYGLSIHLNK